MKSYLFALFLAALPGCVPLSRPEDDKKVDIVIENQCDCCNHEFVVTTDIPFVGRKIEIPKKESKSFWVDRGWKIRKVEVVIKKKK